MADKLADCFDPLGLSDDPETVAVLKGNQIKHARSAMTSMLDYYVQALVTSGGPSAVFGRVADKLADKLDVLRPEVAHDKLGYNRLPKDAREPLQARNKKSDKPAPLSTDDPEAAAVLKRNEIKHAPLAMTSMLDHYVQDLVTSEGPSAASGRVADNLADKLDVPKPEVTYDWLGYNRLPEDARDPLRAWSKKSDKPAPRYVTQLHPAQKWSTLPNSAVELYSPHKVPSWDKTHQHPTTATAVRGTAPRQHTNISRQTATDPTTTNPTAVRSPAPRYTHPNTKRTRTTPYKTWTLHLIMFVINIMALLYYIGDGGAEPCSPPANNTNLTTCITNGTNNGLRYGGKGRNSPTLHLTSRRHPYG